MSLLMKSRFRWVGLSPQLTKGWHWFVLIQFECKLSFPVSLILGNIKIERRVLVREIYFLVKLRFYCWNGTWWVVCGQQLTFLFVSGNYIVLCFVLLQRILGVVWNCVLILIDQYSELGACRDLDLIDVFLSERSLTPWGSSVTWITQNREFICHLLWLEIHITLTSTLLKVSCVYVGGVLIVRLDRISKFVS